MRAGRRPARNFVKFGSLAAAIAVAAAPLPAAAASVAAAQSLGIARGGDSISDFYRARQGRPLWLAPASGMAAQRLLELLSEAEVDGLDPDRYQVRKLERAVRSAQGGKRAAVDRAELMLSQAFVAYARDLRRAPDIGMKYVDRELVPGPPLARALLEDAARADLLPTYVRRLGWMHPTYGELRQALAGGNYRTETERRTLALNLERARALPGGKQRHIVVNTAAQRLFMYEDGRVVDFMRVVVGKKANPTPMMAAYIRYTSLNPYWNVPPDLAAERIAPNVVKQGVRYLRSHGYQVLSDWTDSATVIDPNGIDWQAVADGRTEVRVRQLPGPGNAMGRMKFMFPNDEGVYLHDTPERELLEEASRMFSGGCVRLEDAPRLARWLYGKSLAPQGASPEQPVPLAQLVPVYLTYLTAVPSGSQIAYFDDIYGRDAARLAQLQGSGNLASR